MSINIAAVVVTYNRKNLLKLVLDSLIKQSPSIRTIYLVDNASSDGTSEMLEINGYTRNDRIFYMRLKENTGGAGGFSVGLEKAYEESHDWIWIMDDDAVPHDNSLQLLVNAIEENPKLECVAPVVLDANGIPDLVHRGSIEKNLFGIVKHTDLNKNELFVNDLIEVDFCSFVGPMYSRNLINKVGLPNDNLFIHHDDFEFSIRMKRLKFRCTLVTKSKILHLQAAHNSKRQNIFGFEMDVPVDESKIFLKYFSPRNLVWINRKYSGLVPALVLGCHIVIKEFARHIKSPLKYKRNIYFYINAVFDGLTNKLGAERPKKLLAK